MGMGSVGNETLILRIVCNSGFWVQALLKHGVVGQNGAIYTSH